MEKDILGRDIKAAYFIRDERYEDVDFDWKRQRKNGLPVKDITPVSGVDNGVQAVIHRIKTVKGELAPLGHQEYGSRHHELIGQPNSVNNRNLVKLYILQALSREPRVKEINEARIDYDRKTAPGRVTIALTLTFQDSPEPVNLVIPFSFMETV